MLKLRSSQNIALSPVDIDRRLILRVTTNPQIPRPLRATHALLTDDARKASPDFALTLLTTPPDQAVPPAISNGIVLLDPELLYLGDGDVVRVTPTLKISVMFRKNANAHSLLVTERCNSFCVMCSQPPRDVDDGYIVDDLLEAIPLFDRDTKEIGFTGGEPTLLGPKLIELIRCAKSYLPKSALHILSNGRRFSSIELARAVAAVGHPDVMIGIPLYSDIASIHDFIVQADGAFDETVRGILNLKRCNVRVEIRHVLHRHTISRLKDFSRFLARNLLFADHIALMGLELMGFAKANLDDLWVDPFDYQSELSEAANFLNRAGFRVSIYNHQLCVLHESARPYAVKSISDWKNEYMPECTNCGERSSCGGFFSSAHLRHSSHIHPIEANLRRHLAS